MTSLSRRRALARFTLIASAVFTLIPAANAQEAKPTVYKIVEAGVQMELPPGWEASKETNGTHAISKKHDGGFVVYSLSVLPRDASLTIDSLFDAFSEGIYESARKDWKGFKPGNLMKDTADGAAVRAQKFEGSMESAGGELEGLVAVIDFPKPLGIFGQRTKKHSDVLEKEGSDILASIKKIPQH